jgi:hypothetical protein
MRLAGATRADEQDILPLVEILAFDQLQHERLVDARPSLKVEFIQQLVGGESGHLQSPFGCLAFSFD